MTPFLSIVTVTRNDAWALTKTIRSVFRQSFRDFEYLVVDGDSTDGTPGLLAFWQAQGLIDRAVSEPDTGVYNGMNKGLRMARGQHVCFLNAGDVLAHDDVLARVHALLQDGSRDGVLGWGELNGQVWASWVEHEAFQLASLGFCHQALYVRRSLLLAQPFDERPFKTDSDTLQLGRLYAAGARIAIVPEVLAVRGGEPGISADLARTQASILDTLTSNYPALDSTAAAQVLAFRRQAADPGGMLQMLASTAAPLRLHLALMVLDTLFLRQSAKLAEADADALFLAARQALVELAPAVEERWLDRLLAVQDRRQQMLVRNASATRELRAQVTEFSRQEDVRLARLRAGAQASRSPAPVVVSLTSFPARIPTLHLVIQSLVAQTCRPAEIHVWLGADEVPGRQWLPKALLALESQGLQVHFARRTHHQYDKFLHNSGLNADRPFIIVDDDVIYPPHAIEALLTQHQAHPQAVVANRCHRLLLGDDGEPRPYRDWPREIRVDQPSLLAFPTGAGGVLYPPGFMNHPMVTVVQDILAHAPYADDIWLKVCALARGIPTMTTPLSQGADWYLRYTPTMRSGALHATNVDLGLNDIQLRSALQWLSGVRPPWRAELLAENTA